MTTQEIANRLVELCRKRKNFEAIHELYHDNIVSLEPKGHVLEELHGMDAIIGKSQHFYESVDTIHSQEISDPLVMGNHFTISIKSDITFGMEVGRMILEEICVYRTGNGKIIQEQFFYELAE